MKGKKNKQNKGEPKHKEEYANKLKEDDDHTEDKETSRSYEDDQELEIDHLNQIIADLKEDLETEKSKVQNLNETIINKNSVIESLEEKNQKENTYVSKKKQSKCRYWNKGFCREGDKCNFSHKREDCNTYLNTGKCKERTCQERHRRSCRYFATSNGCFRGDSCQYLHSTRNRVKRDNNDKLPDSRKEFQDEYSCQQCEYKTAQKINLEKHVKTKHENCSFSETASSFISRLELEHLSKDYKKYFNMHGFNREEANFMEKMVGRHGSYYIYKVLE